MHRETVRSHSSPTTIIATAMRPCGPSWNQTMPSSDDDDEGLEATGLKKRRNLSPLLQPRGTGGRGLRLRLTNGLPRPLEHSLTKLLHAPCPTPTAFPKYTPRR